jgi:hypothetical protein
MAFLGSLLGSALRAGLKVAEERLDAGPDAQAQEMNLNINGSAVAAVGGGLMGLLFGTRTAFWSGVALGAAGTERFDMRILRVAGVDVDALIARARSMAQQAGQGPSMADENPGAADAAASAMTVERPIAGETTEIPIESPTTEPA